MMNTFLSTCLVPLSWLYRAVVAARISAYQRGWLTVRTLPVPVISIGNIALGGTGKTPLVIHVAQLLKEQGYRPAVVSRGYRRKGNGVNTVSDGQQILLPPTEAGDEPYLMAFKLPGVPVIVGKDRWRAGMMAVERYECNIIVLDDGFQHLKLHRDIDIVAVDATAPFGRLLPGGRFREPADHLRRADLIVLTRGDQCENLEAIRRGIIQHVTQRWDSRLMDELASCRLGVETLAHSTSKHSETGRHILVIVSLHKPVRFVEPTGCEHSLDALREQPVFVVSGIGKPEAFEGTVAGIGSRIVGRRRYRDHHWYTAQDLEQIVREASLTGAEVIVTTEKDLVRFPKEIIFPLPLMAIEITIDILEGERFLSALIEQLCLSKPTILSSEVESPVSPMP